MQKPQDPQTTEAPFRQPLTSPQPPDEPYYRRGDQARRWGGILLLVGLVWLVFAVSSRAPLLSIGLAEQTANSQAALPGGSRVVIVGGPDNIEIIAADDRGVSVEATKYGFGLTSDAALDALNQLEVDFRPEGDTLYVEVRRPFGTMIGRAPFADLQVALPAGGAVEANLVSGEIVVTEVAGDLSLSTVSGNIDVQESAGSLVLSTTSGDLQVSEHAGPVSAESVSGDVQLAGVLESPRVETVSGDARLEGAVGRVELSSISGDLDLEGAGLADLRVESTSGDIEARFGLAPGGAGAISNISGDVRLHLDNDLQLDVTTASGEISSNLRGLDEERRSLRGSLGTGEASLTVNTTSGDVEVRGE